MLLLVNGNYALARKPFFRVLFFKIDNQFKMAGKTGNPVRKCWAERRALFWTWTLCRNGTCFGRQALFTWMAFFGRFSDFSLVKKKKPGALKLVLTGACPVLHTGRSHKAHIPHLCAFPLWSKCTYLTPSKGNPLFKKRHISSHAHSERLSGNWIKLLMDLRATIHEPLGAFLSSLLPSLVVSHQLAYKGLEYLLTARIGSTRRPAVKVTVKGVMSLTRTHTTPRCSVLLISNLIIGILLVDGPANWLFL